MSYYKFERSDIFANRIKTHPRSYFLIHDNKTFYNNDVAPIRSGEETILHTPQGYLSLYEININRTEQEGNAGLVYPYITKQGTLESFGTVSTEAFQGFAYGDEISGSYPLSASISTDYYTTPNPRSRIYALKNTLEYYRTLSTHYAFQTSDWDKSTQDIKLISIPSIFYGSSIKKGSVKLNYYIEGELIATIEDKNKNGELVQTFGQITSSGGTGTVAASAEIGFNSSFGYDDKRIILEDTEGTVNTFIFDESGAEGATGTVDGSGFIIVQINGLFAREDVATEFATAINLTDLKITTTDDTNGQIALTQDIAGISGNTTIGDPDSIQDLAITQFSGGLGGGTPTTEVSEHNGKVAGVVLYNEGFVALTGSWDLSVSLNHQEQFITNADNDNPRWIYWGEKDTADEDQQQTSFAISSSWDINFLGTNYIPTMTMLAHARQGELNYSSNPTFIDYEDRNDETEQLPLSPNKYVEDSELHIANIAQSPHSNAAAAFEKTTYISKIGIYDENKNLIGIAKLATPVRKTESRQYTFKCRIDF